MSNSTSSATVTGIEASRSRSSRASAARAARGWRQRASRPAAGWRSRQSAAKSAPTSFTTGTLAVAEPAILPFDWQDPFDLNHQLTHEERLVRDTAEGYAQEKLLPRVTSAYLNERFDREIMNEFGELGLLGATIPHEYGGARVGYARLGLLARAAQP